MLPTDLQLCDLAAAAYTEKATWENGRVQARLTTVDGVTVIAFRGTANVYATVIDAEVVPAFSLSLGWVHGGFYWDVYDFVFKSRVPQPSGPYIVTGHSKGAAEALLYSGMMAAMHLPPLKVTTFGCPRVCWLPNFGMMSLALAGIGGTDYRNADDPVTQVPHWTYYHPRPLYQLGDEWGDVDVIGDHRISAYRTALGGLQ